MDMGANNDIVYTLPLLTESERQAPSRPLAGGGFAGERGKRRMPHKRESLPAWPYKQQRPESTEGRRSETFSACLMEARKPAACLALTLLDS